MKSKISPKFGPEKFTGKLEDCIEIYEDRIRGWMLAPARKLLADPEDHFGALTILLTYFEQYGGLLHGVDTNGSAKKYFKAGWCSLFRKYTRSVNRGATAEVKVITWGPVPDVDKVPREINKWLDVLYHSTRCGLMHEGMTRYGVFLGPISSGPIAIVIDDQGKVTDTFMIDVPKFFNEIERNLSAYVMALRNPINSKLRRSFMKTWKLRQIEKTAEFPDFPP